MRKCKITFRFYTKDNDHDFMETTHEGIGFDEKNAVSNAWENMSKDNFNRNIILQTNRISVVNKEFLLT